MEAGGGRGDSGRRRGGDAVVARWRILVSGVEGRGVLNFLAGGGVDISDIVDMDLVSSSEG